MWRIIRLLNLLLLLNLCFLLLEKLHHTLRPRCSSSSLQPKKLGFSNLTHLRRRRPDDSTDYVCPIEGSSPQSGQVAVNGVQVRPYAGFRGLSPILDREGGRTRDQVGLDAGAADASP